MASTFRAALDFFGEVGIYDVILPFLLVFTLVFAILEKTKLFGFEDKEKKYTRKNLNSMVAFVVSFLVVGSAKLVAIINQAVSQVFLLLLLGFLFMLLIGVFLKDEELAFERKDKWFIFFSLVMLIGIVLIFLNAIPTESGGTWLSAIWNYISQNWNSAVVGAIIMILIVIGMMYYVITPSKAKEKKSEE